MSTQKKLAASMARVAAPKLLDLAPGATSSVIHSALDHALKGIGPLKPAAAAAEEQLAEQHGDVEQAVGEVIENNVMLASASGFLTNVGGLMTTVMLAPANVAGLALVQARMVAGIAHLRGYDLDDMRVHNAILVTMLGQDRVRSLVKKGRVPAPPMALATAPVYDAHLDEVAATELAAEMMSRVVGKRLAVSVGRRVPVVGGAVGASADGLSTWRIGRYARRELRARPGI